MLPVLVQADCKVFVPVKDFNYAGIPVRFDFYSIFYAKGFEEVAHIGEANFELVLSDEESEGTFHKAIVRMEMKDLDSGKSKLFIEEKKTCYTQYCGVSDFQKVWVKAYKKLNKSLKKCE